MSISGLFLHRFHVFLDNFQCRLQHWGVHAASCVTSHSEVVPLSPVLYMGCCAGLPAFLEEETGNDCSSVYKQCLTIYKAQTAANLHLSLSRVNICHWCFCIERRSRAGKMPTPTGMPAQRPACRADDCERAGASLHHVEGYCHWEKISEDTVSFPLCIINWGTVYLMNLCNQVSCCNIWPWQTILIIFHTRLNVIFSH